MTEAGLEKIKIAKDNGSWASYDGVEEGLLPADLIAALKENQAAKTNFMAFSNSSKKIILWWIESAKRDDNRQNRIKETIRLAEQNIKANHYRQ